MRKGITALGYGLLNGSIGFPVTSCQVYRNKRISQSYNCLNSLKHA